MMAHTHTKRPQSPTASTAPVKTQPTLATRRELRQLLNEAKRAWADAARLREAVASRSPADGPLQEAYRAAARAQRSYETARDAYNRSRPAWQARAQRYEREFVPCLHHPTSRASRTDFLRNGSRRCWYCKDHDTSGQRRPGQINRDFTVRRDMACQYVLQRRERIQAMEGALFLAQQIESVDPKRAARIVADVEADFATLEQSRQPGKSKNTYRNHTSAPTPEARPLPAQGVCYL